MNNAVKNKSNGKICFNFIFVSKILGNGILLKNIQNYLKINLLKMDHILNLIYDHKYYYNKKDDNYGMMKNLFSLL